LPRRQKSWGISQKLIICALLGLCLLFMFFRKATAQTPPPPNIGIQIEALPKIAAVGDPIRIELDISAPQEYRIDIPRPGQQIGDFTILDFFPGPTVPDIDTAKKTSQSPVLSKGTPAHHRTRIIAAVYKTGKFAFPSFLIYLTNSAGKKITFSSPPVDVEIQSILTEKDQYLKDLKKQAEIAEPKWWILWLGLSLAACILGFVAWRYWRSHKKGPLSAPSIPLQDPFDLAESDLRNLIARKFPENGQVKKHYVLLSEIVKRILESGYQIHTAERTTSEIMDSLHQRPGIETESLRQVETFLLQCDLVKFAKYTPSKEENNNTGEDAFRILALARKTVSGHSWSREDVASS
jgi:hypothetical protein